MSRDTERFRRIVIRLLRKEKFKEIARAEGVSCSYISHVRARAGIPRRVNPK